MDQLKEISQELSRIVENYGKADVFINGKSLVPIITQIKAMVRAAEHQEIEQKRELVQQKIQRWHTFHGTSGQLRFND